MESVKLPLPSCVKNPGLAAVRQCAQNASSVDLDLAIFRELLVGPYSLSQLGNGSSSLADALVARTPEKEYQRYEVIDNLQFVFQDCNVGK